MPFKRILLVKPAGRKGLSFSFDLIPIGLEYIASYIKDAVDQVNIVDLELDNRKFQDIINRYSPDLVGITLSATEHNQSLRLAKTAKQNNLPVVVGGYHPTSVPELMLSHTEIDAVIRGEGEVAMKELVETGAFENVLGLSYKKNGKIIHNQTRKPIENLDTLPFPARYLRQYPYKSQDRVTDCDVIAMYRGCNGLCSFCCEPSMSQSCLRTRSPENVMKELLEMAEYHKGKPVNVMFADPHFMGNPKQVDRLCDLMMKHTLNMEFCALVRADAMAAHPQIVKKMCQVGIRRFEMGIESPNAKDLKATKKGITNKVHVEAVKNIRENGGRAGGTFVIGLPEQTEEEIRMFPVYAKEIGLTGAAFGIATPFPGTDFYKELDAQGLIFETDWNNFDEMHSVYTTKYLSKEKIEEMATYCMAKFWNLDTFFDHERVSQAVNKQKKTLVDFVQERIINLSFMTNNGTTLQKDHFEKHIATFLEAYIDPRVEMYTRQVGVHDILEMRRFLSLLGAQTIQCTLKLDDKTTSFVFKTSKTDVKYIRVIEGRQGNSTITFEVDLKWLSEPANSHMLNRLALALSGNLTTEKMWSTCRLFIALGVDVLAWNLQKIRKN
ncbi:MAG: B12-binding domain-containing radical SAM protein [Candidatus Bathyarchaeota archaeon]|nr:B12-binding domain-containing radical SAM protein [Candidatus Bathyarchaeota archaeon]